MGDSRLPVGIDDSRLPVGMGGSRLPAGMGGHPLRPAPVAGGEQQRHRVHGVAALEQPTQALRRDAGQLRAVELLPHHLQPRRGSGSAAGVYKSTTDQS